MAYKLVFQTGKGEKVFYSKSLKQEALQKAIILKNDAPKYFLISLAEKKGRMFYGLMRQMDFDIIKLKKGEENAS
jgi:hypothetical protein